MEVSKRDRNISHFTRISVMRLGTGVPASLIAHEAWPSTGSKKTPGLQKRERPWGLNRPSYAQCQAQRNMAAGASSQKPWVHPQAWDLTPAD